MQMITLLNQNLVFTMHLHVLLINSIFPFSEKHKIIWNKKKIWAIFCSSQIGNWQKKTISTSSCPPPVQLHLGTRRCRRKWICPGGCRAWSHPPSPPPSPAPCGTNTAHGKTVPRAPEVEDKHSVIQGWGKDPQLPSVAIQLSDFGSIQSQIQFLTWKLRVPVSGRALCAILKCYFESLFNEGMLTWASGPGDVSIISIPAAQDSTYNKPQG